jgi:hypothetical protein
MSKNTLSTNRADLSKDRSSFFRGYRGLAAAATTVVSSATATVAAEVVTAAAEHQQENQDPDPAIVITTHVCLPPFQPSLASYDQKADVCRFFQKDLLFQKTVEERLKTWYSNIE